MEIPLGTNAVANEVENSGISNEEVASDSVDDNDVTSSDVDEAKAESQSKTLHFKTKKNQNMERFYCNLVTIKSYIVQVVCMLKVLKKNKFVMLIRKYNT